MSKPSNRTVSESAQVLNLYKQLRKSKPFTQLEEDMKSWSNEVRRNASKSQDTAFGELRFADGIEYVINHIKTMGQ